MMNAQQLPGANPDGIDVVDRKVLEAMARGDAAVEREFITLYRRLNREDMEKLRQAIAEGDIAGALHTAHRISGAARMIGAASLAAVGGVVEAASRAGNMHDVEANLPALEQQVLLVDNYLESFLLEKR
ncbi:MAG: Hpt domain-containing protein [Betaproteobacteria bacterium]